MQLPEIPDDDADFTPDLARKIVGRYQEIITNCLSAQSNTHDAYREMSARALLAETHLKEARRVHTTPTAWLVTAGDGYERHLIDNEQEAKKIERELNENGWNDVTRLPLFTVRLPAELDMKGD